MTQQMPEGFTNMLMQEQRGCNAKDRLPQPRFPFYSTTVRTTIPAGQTEPDEPVAFHAERETLFTGISTHAYLGSQDATQLDIHTVDWSTNSDAVSQTAGAPGTLIPDMIVGFLAKAGQSVVENVLAAIAAENVAAPGSWTVELVRRETIPGEAPGAWVNLLPAETRNSAAIDDVQEAVIERQKSFLFAEERYIEYGVFFSATMEDATIGAGQATLSLRVYVEGEQEKNYDFSFSTSYCRTESFSETSARAFAPCCLRKPLFIQKVADNKDLMFNVKLNEAKSVDTYVFLTLYGVQGKGCC